MAITEERMATSAVAVTNVSVTSLVNEDSLPIPKASLPITTSSQSPEYCQRLADISSRATLSERLNVTFQREKTGRSTPVTPDLLYAGVMKRVETKIAAGAFVVEAGNFGAVAIWEPPPSNSAPLTETQLREVAAERPIFAEFVRQIQEAKAATFGRMDQAHWTMSLLARDPRRNDKGVVRAVVEPYLKQAMAERTPVWLVAGSAHARKIYEYFSFRVVKLILSDAQDGEEAVPSWCMVYGWPPN